MKYQTIHVLASRPCSSAARNVVKSIVFIGVSFHSAGLRCGLFSTFTFCPYCAGRAFRSHLVCSFASVRGLIPFSQKPCFPQSEMRPVPSPLAFGHLNRSADGAGFIGMTTGMTSSESLSAGAGLVTSCPFVERNVCMNKECCSLSQAKELIFGAMSCARYCLASCPIADAIGTSQQMFGKKQQVSGPEPSY
jgi:hypothetical protein